MVATPIKDLFDRETLTQEDDEKESKLVQKYGNPYLRLSDFINHVLLSINSKLSAVSIFCRFVENYGLIIYDNDNLVSTTQLLELLTHRETQCLIDADNLEFWATLKNERNYHVRIDNVARAYYLRGNETFDWYNGWIDGKVIQLAIPDEIKADVNQSSIDVIYDDIEGELEPYGEPELLPSDAINFYQAKNLLGNDWTAEEFAIQVIHGSIRLFEKSNNDTEKLRPFTNEAEAVYMNHCETEFFTFDSDSIEKALLNFKYSKPELLKFKPECRYISFNDARDLVAKSTGDIKKAEVYLMSRLERGVIYAIHPAGWFPPRHSLNGERWRSGYFDKSKLEQLIADEFSDTETPSSVTNLLLMPDSEAIEAVADNEIYKMPYTLAKRILKQKYHATQEEIALWIETKEIIPKDAWGFTTVGKKEKELYRWDGLSSYEPKDLTSKLSDLYFNGDEINKFVPKVRWISFNQIVERWKAQGENVDETVATLKDSIGVYPKDEELKNGENLQKYQYPLADIDEIEKKLFSLLPETKTEIVKGVVLEAEDKTFNRPLSSHHEPDPRIRFRHKFGETLSLTELMQHWQSNFNFINEFAFAKKIRPNLDNREARVDIKNGKRIFSFISLPTDGQDCIVEDVDDCPQYTELPENTYFYWTDILSYEEAHPEIKKRILELDEERAKANNEQLLTPSINKSSSLDADTDIDSPELLKSEKQIIAILRAIKIKSWQPLAIPDGGKGMIRQICETDYSDIFDCTSSFDEAWRKRDNNLIRMANHASYAKRGKQ